MAGPVRSREAERLARQRREMKCALAEGVTVLEARARLSFRAWQAQVAAFEQRGLRADGSSPQRDAVPDRPRPWMMDQ